MDASFCLCLSLAVYACPCFECVPCRRQELSWASSFTCAVIAEKTRGVAALASPRVPSCFCRDCGDDSRGGCFGEPPSDKLFLP